jgi:spore germination cell wall hydrolase CwlJ-like protein
MVTMVMNTLKPWMKMVAGAAAVSAMVTPLLAPTAAARTATPTPFNASESDCLSLAIYYEARSESDVGQHAVAQVVLNRVADPAYPNDVCSVVFQGAERRTGCQFSFTCDGSMARRPQGIAWTRARQIAAAALAGRGNAPVGNATHYHTTAIRPYWAPSLTRVATIGAHIFYSRPRSVDPARISFARVEQVVLRASDDLAGGGSEPATVTVSVHRGKATASR